MGRRRLERVTELIHQEVSKRIPLLKDPGLGFITIIAVRLTADFKTAKVFYSCLGSKEEQDRTKEALDRARGYLRSELGSLESLYSPPELFFVEDHSAEEAQKVLEILDHLNQEREDKTPNPIAPDLPTPEPKPEIKSRPSRPKKS